MKNVMRFRSLDAWLQSRHGEKVLKIPLDAGSGCPNRDGTLGKGGCTFCNPLGAGTGMGRESFAVQWDRWRARLSQSPRSRRVEHFLGYIQSFTNTYGPASRLCALLDALAPLPGLVGASLGTRPDCLDEEKMAILAGVPWEDFWLEIGVQSCRDETLFRIRRGHTVKQAEEAIALAAAFGVKVCVHLMAGLPGESGDDFLDTVRWAAAQPVQGVKLHNLYVPAETALAEDWRAGRYQPLSQEDYAELAARALTLLPSSFVIHRLAADPARGELLAPDWAAEKGLVLLAIRRVLEYNDWWQGKACDVPAACPFEAENGKSQTA